jgi:hypothetical protein
MPTAAGMLPSPTWLGCRPRLCQLGSSTCPEFKCRVAGGRFQAGGTFQWQGSVVLWFVVEKQNPAPVLTVIIIITWHPSALGNQTATIYCVAIAEWPPSLVYFSPSRFIASRDSNVSHREGGCRVGTFPSDIIAWVRMPRYPYMLLLSPCGVPINPMFAGRAGPGVLAALISASPGPGIPRVSREQLDKLEACVWAFV